MKKLLFFGLIALLAVSAAAQPKEKDKKDEKKSAPVIVLKADAAPLELAKAALSAHGGDKFKNMKSLVVRGTADVSGSPTQTIPASFDFITKGEKYRIDINNPFQPLKQVFDGEQTSSSIPNFSFPPLNRIGLALLPKIGEKDYIVSALEDKKKKFAFRITSPEGYYTDFFLDEKTGQVKSYQSSFDVGGRTVTTAVDFDKFREVEGVFVPEKYSQRFELGGNLTIYSSFKAKEIVVNSDVSEDIFKIP